MKYALQNLVKVSMLGSLMMSACSFAQASPAPDTVACPSNFYSLPVPANAKQCQRFDSELPATMVYFASTNQRDLIAQYQRDYPELEVNSQFQGRTLLTAKNNTVRVIISPDNEGSQVDIMITQPDNLLTRTSE